MRWLPLILICLLIYIESVIFVRIASEIGVLFTLLLVVLTSCVGVSLVRNQGIKNLISMQQKMAAGESPANEAIKSVSLVISGFLLILPGFFTDFLGLLLLLSPVQQLLTAKLLPYINFYRPNGTGNHGTGNHGQTFEGEYERKQDDASSTINHKRDHDQHHKDNNDK
ncbi:MAG: FxsA family protein [Enterobacteriaceae bacterium]|jgi:UPF0716 protein FxsA|nr:FxsA family protein [Enterobacteriaceae bacterium]